MKTSTPPRPHRRRAKAQQPAKAAPRPRNRDREKWKRLERALAIAHSRLEQEKELFSLANAAAKLTSQMLHHVIEIATHRHCELAQLIHARSKAMPDAREAELRLWVQQFVSGEVPHA